jgi:hypothetical protein
MTPRHLILRTIVPAMTTAAIVAPGASAMPAQNTGCPAAKYPTRMHHSVPLPARVDAAAHEATIRGIGAALAERARP